MDKNDFFPWTQIPATFPIDIASHQSLMNCSLDMNFYNTRSNWDYSLDQNDQFESALSSVVSSPAASVTPAAFHGGDRVQLIELIGKLGRISSPSEIDVTPRSYIVKNNYQSSSNSSYITPANSPPKLNLPSAADHIKIRGKLPALAPLATNPGVAERVAKLSCFGSQSYNERFQSQCLVNVSSGCKVSGSHQDRINNIQDNTLLENRSDSKEESPVSQKVQGNERNGRKRKSIPRTKAKTTSKVGVGSKDSNSKRTKIDQGEKGGKEEQKEDSKAPEPLKDFIHVRARRGQATDSHSLAERVRREKISERMKFLQDLVPGCDKVTGKAVMLDEIIYYVQSLQRQVECLSMKLSTMNPMMYSARMEALLSKEILQSRIAMYSMETSNSGSTTFPYAYQSQEPPCVQNAATDSHFCNNDHQRQRSINGFSNSASQVSMWEDELHNVVQMGFAPGTMEPPQMKMEP